MISSPPPESDPSQPAQNARARSLGRSVLINAGSLSASSLWRIGVSFVLQLMIARVLGVYALGVYTVALAYLNVGQVISELGLPALLTRDLAASPQMRRAYYGVALRVQLLASIVVWAGLAALALLLPYSPAERAALILIGASLPFYAITSASQTLFRASERMEFLMGVEVFINSFILVASVLLLLAGTTVLRLIGVLVITQAISALTCSLIVVNARLLAPPQLRSAIPLRELWGRASPFFALSIAEVLQQRMDIVLLSVIAGPTVTGIYSAAYNLVRVLVKLVQSVWQALYPTLSRLYQESSPKFQTLCDLSLRYGLMVLLPVAAFTAGTADEVVRLIYSVEYAASAPVLQRLIWTAPALFVEAYAVTVLMTRGRPLHSLAIMATHLAALAAILPVLAAFGGAAGAALASAMASLIGAAAGLTVLHRLSIPVSLQRIGLLVVAAILAGALVYLMPLYWLLNVAAGIFVYLALLRFSGVLGVEDLAVFRNALRPEPD